MQEIVNVHGQGYHSNLALHYAPEVVDVDVLRGIEEVDDVPVPAYLTAGESCANPTEGGSYR
jgi:hypothetical protein